MTAPAGTLAGDAIAIAEVPVAEFHRVGHLVSPWVRTAIGRFADKARLVAAFDEETPVALAAGLLGPNRDFEVLSVYVSPFHRRRGLGTALLRRLEDVFTRGPAGATIGLCELTIDPDDQGGAAFLMAAGWRRPTLTAIICHSTMDLAFETPWLVNATLPAGYRVAAWSEVAGSARADIEAGLGGWVPQDLDPYAFEEGADDATSVALLDGTGRVRGWVITHLVGDHTVRWTCSHVDPRIAGQARVVPLWLECARRQRALGGPQAFTYSIPVEKPRMVKFAVRRMRPWLTGLYYAATTTRRFSG